MKIRVLSCIILIFFFASWVSASELLEKTLLCHHGLYGAPIMDISIKISEREKPMAHALIKHAYTGQELEVAAVPIMPEPGEFFRIQLQPENPDEMNVWIIMPDLKALLIHPKLPNGFNKIPGECVLSFDLPDLSI